MSEQWRPVVGYEGLYEVSDQGRVRSLDRVVGARAFRGRHLSPTLVSSGHLVVTLNDRGRRRREYVHRLVAMAFLPNPDDLPFVCHRNDLPADNRLSNLYWGTQSGNARDAVRNKRNAQSRKTHCDRGHELSEGNTRVRNGNRWCRACDAMRARLRRARAVPLLPGDPRHGVTGYSNHLCRCDVCREASTAYRRELRRKSRAAA